MIKAILTLCMDSRLPVGCGIWTIHLYVLQKYLPNHKLLVRQRHISFTEDCPEGGLLTKAMPLVYFFAQHIKISWH